MADKPLRVLLVGDSPAFRELVRYSVQLTPEIAIVGVAKGGEEALSQAIRLEPSVIALDVQMPKLDGQKMLEAILAVGPIPVLMVGSLNEPAAECSLRAIEAGALDYIARPTGSLDLFRAEFLQKLKHLARADVQNMVGIRRKGLERPPKTAAPALPMEPRVANCCIAIGISTGGPPVLTELFAALSPPMPPIVVVQHMPGAFTGPFAKRLDGISNLTIREAADGAEVLPNEVLIAQGGRQLRLKRSGGRVTARLTDQEPVSGHRPSIDVMMSDIATIYGAHCLGIIMTGMGHDGVAGCRAIRERGGDVWGQDQATSAVYGMNKAAFAAGWVTHQFAVQDLPPMLQQRALSLLAAVREGAHERASTSIR